LWKIELKLIANTKKIYIKEVKKCRDKNEEQENVQEARGMLLMKISIFFICWMPKGELIR